MYSLAPEAGGRWTSTTDIEARLAEAFQRYIQSVERMADVLSALLSELLNADDRKCFGEALWQHELARAAESLAEEATIAIEEIAPEDYEALPAFYNLYAKACDETAKAIYDFVDGIGTEAGMREAVLAGSA